MRATGLSQIIGVWQALVMLTCLFCGAAFGQDNIAPASFTPEQLNAFARAEVRIQSIRQRYIGVTARSIHEKNQMTWIRAAMQSDMSRAVKDSGLDQDTYNRIAARMAHDRAFREHIIQLEKRIPASQSDDSEHK